MSTPRRRAPRRDGAEIRAAKALAHPLRVQILGHLRAHANASPTQLADRWGTPLGTVSYHLRRLQALGFVRLVRRTQRRGVIEHHYALGPDADTLLRTMVERALAQPDASTTTTARAVLDATAVAALRPDVQRLVARMKELEAQTLTRAGVIDPPAPGVAVDLVLAVEHGSAA